MNNDPFGHIADARHFQNVGRGLLSQAKEPWRKKYWQDYIDKIEEKIRQMEKWEIEYWKSMHTQPGEEK